MRKSTSAVLVTTLFALSTGSAFALGDRAKEKKAAETPPATQSAPKANVPSAAPNNQVSQADPKCDETKYASRADMPKDCLNAQGKPTSPVAGSTMGQGSGDSGSAASSGSSSGASSSSSASSSGGTGK